MDEERIIVSRVYSVTASSSASRSPSCEQMGSGGSVPTAAKDAGDEEQTLPALVSEEEAHALVTALYKAEETKEPLGRFLSREAVLALVPSVSKRRLSTLDEGIKLSRAASKIQSVFRSKQIRRAYRHENSIPQPPAPAFVALRRGVVEALMVGCVGEAGVLSSEVRGRES